MGLLSMMEASSGGVRVSGLSTMEAQSEGVVIEEEAIGARV